MRSDAVMDAMLDRRGMLAGLGAAVGALAIGRIVVDGPAPGVGVRETLELVAPDLRRSVPGTPPGTMPALDVPPVAHGVLADVDGAVVGRLDGATVPATGGDSALHTITLADGALVAIGPHDHAGPFAIVGGSGRFEGARGRYVLRPLDAAGRAHALTIELTTGG